MTEPELMDDAAQAAAYAAADFSEPHGRIVEAFAGCFPDAVIAGPVLDLGCGPGDISFRFAARYPGCTVLGVDGAAAMLRLAGQRRSQEPLTGARVHFIAGQLPGAPIPPQKFTAIISNSLLHHLHDPAVLWQTIVAYAHAGTLVYVTDLLRPPTLAAARRLVETQAAGEPAVLQRDFFNSLCAAFEPHEVRAQLHAAGLDELAVDRLGDRHLVVHGVRR